MSNVAEDRAPLEPGDSELHPEIADLVTVQPPQPDETDRRPASELEVEDS